jgi:diguanylate cyclase (GGDEF)-like protein
MEIVRRTDEITGAWNRKFFIEIVTRELLLSRRHDFILSILLLDIDYFKEVNDSYGQMAGDFVLRELVKVLKTTVRGSDIICRYGGDEFVILLPYTNLENSRLVAERVREKVNNYTFKHEEKEIHVTVSIGLSSCEKSIYDIDRLIKIADDGLYSAKYKGRDRVEAVSIAV